MNDTQLKSSISKILELMPSDWLDLTTHRLDIYNEGQAKVEFLREFEDALLNGKALENLPTAFDYIRLGHPLSCILEWAIAKSNKTNSDKVISFSSQTMPILAILRKNLFENKKTQIKSAGTLPKCFDTEILEQIYNYKFQIVDSFDSDFDGTSISLLPMKEFLDSSSEASNADFIIALDEELGSITLTKKEGMQDYLSEIQHVRRRESIAMTPQDSLNLLKTYLGEEKSEVVIANKERTVAAINEVANTSSDVGLGSCGLSVQYAIMMGLAHYSRENNPGKEIKFIVPPNCYGGTNDQARRVAACLDNVEIMDLPVDRGQDMVESVEKVLTEVARLDAIPYIIAEIPTNPRVEVPDLKRLKEVLSEKRSTPDNKEAIAPVFILDQTFCPNVKFLGTGDILSGVKTISYVSGSKFPSGGLCTAGYCVANSEAESMMKYINRHLEVCDNKATSFQVNTLADQMPSMNERIQKAYKNTREFVTHIQKELPLSKINFVSVELAELGFTPSVFSLDLPTKGSSPEERESYKRDLNLKLIRLMVERIPTGSKHCVSYGQLKGCYWTIPATSTQGTTKEGDKDYIVRVAIAPDLDLELHKKTFSAFVEKYI